ncbi:crotonobetainyl-CoA:carnitine CoA-transferase CaiB-like acyl-CoA transferase [Brevibacterium sanguinis]|uniref:Crotonobetainyl-CoA:carnitine CoA-transferase CaiB-like acyl-CoA transferase n=2 Tax=Brevibacterium TaxID=1696 RepID=A0A366INH3_9MICO|nr:MULTISPECIES: CoA transferase [Brevibacterium]RBP67009.1 crotonobetainyl-CoA:carnitine CoA-transferase CaiB-like acyl-CoA transferase [Brevibacterium sanguinis]RBP73534.1 crotonobetainyl-CoA:carnitine CoA-transferase CaiB-like acyl-CoA transferase [Brevibacterium celere]
MEQQDLREIFGRTGSGPLSGVVVADFSRVLAGPYATMMLADLGATVIKVEGPAGDDTRHWAPPRRGDDATYFLTANRNKHSVVLDLKDPDDLALAQELARRADVLVENFKAGGLAKYSLDYESVRELNPGIVYASVTGFGRSNPQPGYDLLIQGMSGFMSVTGSHESGPVKAGVAIVDVFTGLHTAVGILAALAHRKDTGRGQLVETNLLSSALSGLANQTSAYVAGGVVPQPMGNEHPSLYPYQPMPTGEGQIIIAVGNDTQFRLLATVLGHPEWADDERFATNADRNDNRAQLEPLLVAALSAKTNQEWFEILSRAGLPCAPINTIAQGVELAAELGLDPVAEAGAGDRVIPTVSNPIRLSETPPSYDLAPPRLGESSDLVRNWLRGERVRAVSEAEE